jgi:hypothetical protein
LVTETDKALELYPEQITKLNLLHELGVLDINATLARKHYPADPTEATRIFNRRFAFYNQISLDELAKISTLWTQFMDFCQPPSLLLDPNRYSADLKVARFQFEQRLAMYDCYKGVMGVFGKPRTGKSGFVAVHTDHGKSWFDMPVVTYKFKYPPAYGDSLYINDEKFLDAIYDQTKIVEKGNGEPVLTFTSEKAREDFASIFYGKQIVIEEAHKVFPRGAFTRLGKKWYHIIKEFGHYGCLVILISHFKEIDINTHVLKHLTHEVWVSRDPTRDRHSLITIRHMETDERKPVIHLDRTKHYRLWTHNAPIAAETNISSKELARRDKNLKSGEEEED